MMLNYQCEKGKLEIKRFSDASEEKVVQLIIIEGELQNWRKKMRTKLLFSYYYYEFIIIIIIIIKRKLN